MTVYDFGRVRKQIENHFEKVDSWVIFFRSENFLVFV